MLLTSHRFDLLLADLKLPGIDGMAVVRAARASDPEITCMILTGHASLASAIEGLHNHVADYVVKTVAPDELLERVAAVVAQRQHRQQQQQAFQTLIAAAATLGEPDPAALPMGSGLGMLPSGGSARQEVFVLGPLRIDPLRQQVTIDDRQVAVTPTELRILVCLAERAGQTLSPTELVRYARGSAPPPKEAAELIKPHVHHLRQKLEVDPSHPRYLLNVRGGGYVLMPGDGVAQHCEA